MTKLPPFWKSHFVWMTILLLLKTYFVRILLFNDFNLLHSFLLELGPILIICGLIELIPKRKLKTSLYLLVNLLFSIVCLTIILYFEQFNRMVTYYALFQIGLVEDVGGSVALLFKPTYLILFVDIIVFILLLIFRKYPLSADRLPKRWMAPLLIVMLAVSWLNVHYRSTEQVNSNKFAQDAGVINSEVYELYTEVRGEQLPKNLAVTNDNISQIKRTISPRNPKYAGVAKDKNLIVIQLESYQNFLLGMKVNGQEITPNLNKLLKESVYFNHFNTQIGEGNTSDAEFITNTSLYPLENGAITSLMADKAFPSLPKLLEQQGYDTLAFHVNNIKFWNRDKLYPALGIQTYYDASFFGNEDIVGMGPSDEVLFNKSIPVLLNKKSQNQKFYAFYVTLSSHNPFVIPDAKNDLSLPANLNNTLVGNYLKSAHYTDKAVGEFFDNLKKNGLWDQSVVALYGDHFAFVPDTMKANEKQLLSGILNHNFDTVDMFNIPLIIKVPGVNAQVVDRVGVESDTLPTLANLLGISIDNQIHFGEDLLNHRRNLFPIRYYLPTGSYFNSKFLYKTDTGTGENVRTREVITDKTQFADDANRIQELEKMADYYLQHLPERTQNITKPGK